MISSLELIIDCLADDETFLWQMTKPLKRHMSDKERFQLPQHLLGLKHCQESKAHQIPVLSCWQFHLSGMEKGARWSAVLDIILTNREELFEEVKVTGTSGEIDHIMLRVYYNKDKIPDFRTADFDELRQKCLTKLRQIEFNGLKSWRWNGSGKDGYKILKVHSQTIPIQRKTGHI